MGSEAEEGLKDALPQWRSKSSFGRAAIARDKAALTFDSLINFAERQPAEHCPQEQAGRDLHPAMLERNTEPKTKLTLGIFQESNLQAFLGVTDHSVPWVILSDAITAVPRHGCHRRGRLLRHTKAHSPLLLSPFSIYASTLLFLLLYLQRPICLSRQLDVKGNKVSVSKGLLPLHLYSSPGANLVRLEPCPRKSRKRNNRGKGAAFFQDHQAER